MDEVLNYISNVIMKALKSSLKKNRWADSNPLKTDTKNYNCLRLRFLTNHILDRFKEEFGLW